MTDIYFDAKLQPVLDDSKDFLTVNGRDEFEQWVRLEAIDRLYDVVPEYNTEDVPHKIRLELNRMVRESDFIDDVNSIRVERVGEGNDEKITGYRVNVSYSESEQFDILLEGL